VGYLPRVWLAPVWVRELRKLVRYRQQLAADRRDTKLRVGGLLREHRVDDEPKVTRWTRCWRAWLGERIERLPEASAWVIRRQLRKLAWIEDELKAAEARLREYTKADASTQHLLGQPGIGPVTAWVLRAEVGRFSRFDSGRALSRFCGLSPRNASSGQKQADAGLIKAGSALLRTALIEMAHRLGRTDPRWARMRAQMKARGKSGSVIAAAVANRYMRRLYYRMTEYEQQQQEESRTPCGAPEGATVRSPVG